MSLKFSISATKKLKRNVDLNDEDHVKKPKIEQELITSIEKSKIKTLVEQPKQGPMVIPLITRNRYPADLEDEEAVQAIISESLGKKVPIIQVNAIPGIEKFTNESSRFRHDMSMRPDQASLEDYEQVPIEQFGEALLRGMGWSESKAVGRNQRKAKIEPVLLKPRPALLGLGADPFPVPPSATGNNSSSLASKATTLSLKSTFNVGALVKIVDGRYQGKSGKIVEIKERDNGTVVKVDIGTEIVRVWKQDLASSSTEATIFSGNGNWLRPRLVVRIISKTFKDGKYYKVKGVIEDLLSSQEAMIKTENGHLIQVHSRHLETIIPSTNDSVVVVCSSDASLIGQTAKIIEKSNSKQVAVVQLDSTLSIHTMHYDDICQVHPLHAV